MPWLGASASRTFRGITEVKDGKIVDQKLGFQPKNALEDMIKKAL